jgi:hypothetical protein
MEPWLRRNRGYVEPTLSADPLFQKGCLVNISNYQISDSRASGVT